MNYREVALVEFFLVLGLLAAVIAIIGSIIWLGVVSYRKDPFEKTAGIMLALALTALILLWAAGRLIP